MQNKDRRSFLLKATGAGAVAVSSFSPLTVLAQAVKPKLITIVEVANFQCSICRAMNDHYGRIVAQAAEKQIDVRFAPVAWEGQSLWPNRVYYSMRDLYPQSEKLVRDAIFTGIHDEGQPFETLMQVVTYLEGKNIPTLLQEKGVRLDWGDVVRRAEGNEPLFSEIRAGQLIELAGVEEVPSFIWLKDAKVDKLISPTQAPEVGRLASLVIKTINSD